MHLPDPSSAMDMTGHWDARLLPVKLRIQLATDRAKKSRRRQDLTLCLSAA
jgi:hypothetical protein